VGKGGKISKNISFRSSINYYFDYFVGGAKWKKYNYYEYLERKKKKTRGIENGGQRLR
jgi:hypothetical protein